MGAKRGNILTKKIHALAPMLEALNIKQSVTFDEAHMLFADVLKASGNTPPAFEVSGNQWTAIVNLAVARFGSRYGINELEAQRRPLTDAELVELAFKCGVNGLNIHGYTFARAIEQAHGIKEGT